MGIEINGTAVLLAAPVIALMVWLALPLFGDGGPR